MKIPSRDEQRRLVRQWETTGPELERLRRAALRDMPYCWEAVDAVLSLADHYDGPPRTTSGLIELQPLRLKVAPPEYRQAIPVAPEPDDPGSQE